MNGGDGTRQVSSVELLKLLGPYPHTVRVKMSSPMGQIALISTIGYRDRLIPQNAVNLIGLMSPSMAAARDE